MRTQPKVKEINASTDVWRAEEEVEYQNKNKNNHRYVKMKTSRVKKYIQKNECKNSEEKEKKTEKIAIFVNILKYNNTQYFTSWKDYDFFIHFFFV